MNSNSLPLPFAQKSLDRDLLIAILRTSLSVGETHYTRQVALAWLAAYPGDMLVGLMHAQALYQEGHIKQALPILEKICLSDPEYLEAHELLTLSRRSIGDKTVLDSSGCVMVLGGTPDPQDSVPKGAVQLQKAYQELKGGNLEHAENLIHHALPSHPDNPLAAVIHLRIMYSRKTLPNAAIRDIAQAYYDRWPNCLPFILILSDTLMDGGESDRAVALLHQAVARDVAGQVPHRLWGPDHPYRTLWPDHLEVDAHGSTSPQDIPIPAAVSAALGWNQLPPGEPGNIPQAVGEPEAPIDQITSPTAEVTEPPVSSYEAPTEPSLVETAPPVAEEAHDQVTRPSRVNPPIPETLRSVQTELERLAAKLKKPYLARTDGRFPIYVVFTTRQGLEAVYGEEVAAEIDQGMKSLVATIRGRKNWGAILFYADDCQSTSAYGLVPAQHNDPWSLKLTLVDLDFALGKRGEMIGALLIVGGPEVVPFHHLPNPVDDVDVDVPSDNPYAIRDENYFIPEWPVGRLPGCIGDEGGSKLLNSLHDITTHHQELDGYRPWYRRLWDLMVKTILPRLKQIQPSLGYTAAIWRRASLSVFHPIGEPRALLVSPPIQVVSSAPDTGKKNNHKETPFLPTARLGYFNLHGLQDTVEWYGQRDPTEPEEGPDYPVALRPQDVVNSGHAPQLVFTEACYGAHVLNKTVEQALALKFLDSGSQVVIGSTCIAYGSITTPLIAADLLGIAFWNFIRDGNPAGEALRRAKIHLAREMHRRQGYLDGEDQKTLISFVLYGDPLAQPLGQARVPKSILRPLKSPTQVKTICDRTNNAERETQIPQDVLLQVKHVVAQYLPGMADALITFSHERAECHDTIHNCPTAQIGIKARPIHLPDRQLVTLSKEVEQAALVHHHYARLTLDAQGKLVKLVVSR